MSLLVLGPPAAPSRQIKRPTALYASFGKRAFDLAFALLLCPLIAPLILILCLLARRDGAPGLFAHPRVGRNGQVFKCWKIRTMVPNAPDLLTAHLAADPGAAAEWARAEKLTHDPRVTPMGRILRRTSLDELPQIWNVLRGEMSFVGPRPVTEGELARYGQHVGAYLTLRPGITGQWQIHGRTNGCYTQRLQMDVTYAQDITIWHDLGLLGATALLVLNPTGR